jgi:hypothetical protein
VTVHTEIPFQHGGTIRAHGSYSLKFRVRTYTCNLLVGLQQSLGCHGGGYITSTPSPTGKLLVLTSSHVQVTIDGLIDRPDPLSLCSGIGSTEGSWGPLVPDIWGPKIRPGLTIIRPTSSLADAPREFTSRTVRHQLRCEAAELWPSSTKMIRRRSRRPATPAHYWTSRRRRGDGLCRLSGLLDDFSAADYDESDYSDPSDTVAVVPTTKGVDDE